jgi:hypothetical protein
MRQAARSRHAEVGLGGVGFEPGNEFGQGFVRRLAGHGQTKMKAGYMQDGRSVFQQFSGQAGARAGFVFDHHRPFEK